MLSKPLPSEPKEHNHVCYQLAILIKWINLNEQLFKGTTIDISSVNKLYIQPTPKEVFVSDLKKFGPQVYNSTIKSQLLKYF